MMFQNGCVDKEINKRII